MRTKIPAINRLIASVLVLLLLPYGVCFPAVTAAPKVVVKKGVLDPAKIYIPESCGKVDKVSPAPGSEKTVVVVKDAHCIYEAQENIADILELLVKDFGVETICAEGAAGDIDLSLYRDFPDRERRDKTTEKFMRKGYFSAIELFGICREPGRPFRMLGAEDAELYLENFLYFRKNYRQEKEAQGTISGWENILDKLKQKVYSKELIDFDELALKYRNQEMAMSDWIKYVCERLPRAKEQPVLSLTLKCLDLEDKIDFAAVEEEREKALKLLLADLPAEEMPVMVKKGLQLRTGKISQNDYYSYLGEKIKLLAASRPEFKAENLNNYIELIKFQNGIDEEELFRQLDNAEATIYDRLFDKDEQRNLHRTGYKLYVLNKLFQLKVTREELAYFESEIKDREEEITAGLRQLANDHKVLISYKLAALPKTKLPEGFYQLATERDRAMAENVIREMGRVDAASAVLVAGGFHAAGIAEILRQRDINCVTVSPMITQVPDHNPYLKVMLGRGIDTERIRSFITGAISAPRQGNELAAIVDPSVIVSFAQALLAGTTWEALTEGRSAAEQQALRQLFDDANIEIVTKAADQDPGIRFRLMLKDLQALETVLLESRYLSVGAQTALREHLAEIESQPDNPFQMQVIPYSERAIPKARTDKIQREVFEGMSPEEFASMLSGDLSEDLAENGVEIDKEVLDRALEAIMKSGNNREWLRMALLRFREGGLAVQYTDSYDSLFGDNLANGKLIINVGALLTLHSMGMSPAQVSVLVAVGVFGHEIIGHEADHNLSAEEHARKEKGLSKMDALMTLRLLADLPGDYHTNVEGFIQSLTKISAGGLYPSWLAKIGGLFDGKVKEEIAVIKDDADLEVLRMLMDEPSEAAFELIYAEVKKGNYAYAARAARIASLAPEQFEGFLRQIFAVTQAAVAELEGKILGNQSRMRTDFVADMSALRDLLAITKYLPQYRDRDGNNLSKVQEHNISLLMNDIYSELEDHFVFRIIAGMGMPASLDMLESEVSAALAVLAQRGFPTEGDSLMDLLYVTEATCAQLLNGDYNRGVNNLTFLFSRLIRQASALEGKEEMKALKVLAQRFSVFAEYLDNLLSSDSDALEPPVTMKYIQLKQWFGKHVEQAEVIQYQINFEGAEPVAVFPDIHGNIKALNTMIAEAKALGITRFVFMGDYIDRDPNSIAVLDRIEELTKDSDVESVQLLYGNHEIMFIAGMSGNRNAFLNWFFNGGYIVLEKELGISGAKDMLLRLQSTRDRQEWDEIREEIIDTYLPLAQQNNDLQDKLRFMLNNFQMYHVDSANILYIHNLLNIDNDGNFISTLTSRDGQRSLQGMEIMEEAQAALDNLRDGKGTKADRDFLWEMWQPWTEEREWGDVMTAQGEEVGRKMLSNLGGYSGTVTAHDIETKPGTSTRIAPEKRELRRYFDVHSRTDTGTAKGYGAAGMLVTISGADGMQSHKFTAPGQQDKLRDAQQEVDSAALSEAMYGKEIGRLEAELMDLYDQISVGLTADLETGVEEGYDIHDASAVILQVEDWSTTPYLTPTPTSPSTPTAPVSTMEWMQVRAGEHRGELTAEAIKAARVRIQKQADEAIEITVSVAGVTVNFTIDQELAALGISEELLRGIVERIIAQEEGIDLAELAEKGKNITIAMVQQSETYFVNHTSDGFIGINADFLNLFTAEQQAEREIMLEVGLNHEMRHELTGKGETPAVEAEFRQKDMALLLELTAGEMTDLLDTLLQLGLLKDNFVKQALYANLQQVLAEQLPGFQLQLSEAELADLFTKLGLDGAELAQEADMIAFVDQLAVQAAQRAGLDDVGHVRELLGNATDRLRETIRAYLQAQQKAVAASVASASGVDAENMDVAVDYVLGEVDEGALKGKVSKEGRTILTALRDAFHRFMQRLLTMLRGTKVTAHSKHNFPILQPAPRQRQNPGVIVQDVGDVFSEISEDMIEIEDGKMMVSHKLLDSGLREWLEAIRDEDGYDGIGFGFVLSNPDEVIEKDGYLTTRAELFQQLITEHTGLRAEQFVIAASVTEVAEKSEAEQKDNIVYLSSSFTDGQRAELAKQGIKIVQKGQTGMPVAMHWAAVMLDLEIDEVYDAEGRATPFLVMLYANFVDGLSRAGVIEADVKDEIIKEVMEKGYIVLPAVTTVTEFLQNLQRATRLTAVAA